MHLEEGAGGSWSMGVGRKGVKRMGGLLLTGRYPMPVVIAFFSPKGWEISDWGNVPGADGDEHASFAWGVAPV